MTKPLITVAQMYAIEERIKAQITGFTVEYMDNCKEPFYDAQDLIDTVSQQTYKCFQRFEFDNLSKDAVDAVKGVYTLEHIKRIVAEDMED